MAQTPTQLGTKSKQISQPKESDQILRSPPFGAMAPTGNRPDKLFEVGQLAMMEGGLHRIMAVEPISFRIMLGIRCEVTAVSANSITLKADEWTELGDNATGSGSSPSGANGAYVDVQANDTIFLGEQNHRSDCQTITVSSASGRLSSTNGSTVTPNETINTGRISVGDEATLMRIPGATSPSGGAGGAVVLTPKDYAGLESPDGNVIYNLSIGVSEQEAIIDRDGTTTSVIETNKSPNQESIINPSKPQMSIGMAKYTNVGLISPAVRVYQPPGVAKFCMDETAFGGPRLSTSDRLIWGKSGFIESHVSSDRDPNPLFNFWTGVGEQSLPEFQAVNRHINELIAPSLLLIGWKYFVRPVPDEEVIQMVRKAGSFKYEVIPTPFMEMVAKSDSRAGPSEGWHTWVQENRGKRISFEEYRQATSIMSNATYSMLNGTMPSNRQSKREDPRSKYRGL